MGIHGEAVPAAVITAAVDVQIPPVRKPAADGIAGCLAANGDVIVPAFFMTCHSICLHPFFLLDTL